VVGRRGAARGRPAARREGKKFVPRAPRQPGRSPSRAPGSAVRLKDAAQRNRRAPWIQPPALLMNDPRLDQEELATSGSLLAKRLRSLVRAAERRAAPNEFREALGRAVGALELGVDNLFGELGGGEDRGALPDVSGRIAKNIVDAWSQSKVDGDTGEAEADAEQVTFENAPLTGSTDVFPIPDLIDWLGVLGKTGVLVVQGEKERFTIEFQRGRVVHAASDHAPEGSRLGDILVELAAISPEELVEFLERARASGEVLGTALERGQKLTRAELEEALAVQVQRLFARLFAARRSIFAFRQGAVGANEARVCLNPRQLLMESARLADELAVNQDKAREAERIAADVDAPDSLVSEEQVKDDALSTS